MNTLHIAHITSVTHLFKFWKTLFASQILQILLNICKIIFFISWFYPNCMLLTCDYVCSVCSSIQDGWRKKMEKRSNLQQKSYSLRFGFEFQYKKKTIQICFCVWIMQTFRHSFRPRSSVYCCCVCMILDLKSDKLMWTITV